MNNDIVVQEQNDKRKQFDLLARNNPHGSTIFEYQREEDGKIAIITRRVFIWHAGLKSWSVSTQFVAHKTNFPVLNSEDLTEILKECNEKMKDVVRWSYDTHGFHLSEVTDLPPITPKVVDSLLRVGRADED